MSGNDGIKQDTIRNQKPKELPQKADSVKTDTVIGSGLNLPTISVDSNSKKTGLSLDPDMYHMFQELTPLELEKITATLKKDLKPETYKKLIGFYEQYDADVSKIYLNHEKSVLERLQLSEKVGQKDYNKFITPAAESEIKKEMKKLQKMGMDRLEDPKEILQENHKSVLDLTAKKNQKD